MSNEQFDRELLLLAARAAGVTIVWGEEHRVGDDTVDCTDMAFIVSGDREEAPMYWSPLTDDGDALRLAVHLRIKIDFLPDAVRCWHPATGWIGETCLPCDAEYLSKALRRAIVRAAAEIGRTLEAAHD